MSTVSNFINECANIKKVFYHEVEFFITERILEFYSCNKGLASKKIKILYRLYINWNVYGDLFLKNISKRVVHERSMDKFSYLAFDHLEWVLAILKEIRFYSSEKIYLFWLTFKWAAVEHLRFMN